MTKRPASDGGFSNTVRPAWNCGPFWTLVEKKGIARRARCRRWGRGFCRCPRRFGLWSEWLGTTHESAQQGGVNVGRTHRTQQLVDNTRLLKYVKWVSRTTSWRLRLIGR